MSSDNQLQNVFNQFVTAMQKHRRLWIAPTIICGVLGTSFAVFKSSTWNAWQAIHLRDAGSENGQFENIDLRKAAQETVIELSRNRSVIAAALKEYGPPKSLFPNKNWPSNETIISVRRELSVSAPPGTELGNADVIHLSVNANSPDNALRLNKAICNQLDLHLQKLRMSKAQNLVAELENKQSLARNDLRLATAELEKLEHQIGQDLGELRTLDQTGAGESNLRTSLTQISNGLRAAKNRRMAQDQLDRILTAAKKDATKLVSIPDRLLDSQPELRRLKDGLAGAQLRIAELSGKMRSTHPQVRAATRELNEIRSQITNRLPAWTESLRADIEITNGLKNSLQAELSRVEKRLSELASLRAPYSNLISRVQNRRDQLRDVNQALSEAEAQRSSAQSSSVFTLVGETEVSDSPIGPGRATIAVSSCVGGLMIGVGLVLLVSPIASFSNDGIREFGRRATDQLRVTFGRRESDESDATAATGGDQSERRGGSDRRRKPR
ncbi:GumC family protein [Planctomycetota bacterium]